MSNSVPSRPLKRAFVATLIAASLFSVSCNRESKKGAVTGAVAPKNIVDANNPLGLNKSIVAQLPQSVLGFWTISTDNGAFRRFEKSTWGSSTGNSIQPLNFGAASLEDSALYRVFKEAGIDLLDENAMQELVSEFVVFIAPSANPSPKSPLDIGIAMHPRTGVNFDEKFSAIKAALPKNGVAVTDWQVSGANGFTAKVKVSATQTSDDAAVVAQEVPAFVTWTKDSAVVSSSQDLAQAVTANLSSGEKMLPQVVANPDFQRIAQRFGKDDDRYSVGFADLGKIAATFAAADPASEWKKLPAKAVGFEGYMGESPGTNFSLLLDPKTPEQREFLAKIGSPTSPTMFATIPSGPMVFLSFEGSLLRELQSLSGTNGPGGDVAGPLALLANVRRIGISGRVAPVGKSMLPIPDLVIGIETTDPAALQTQIVSLVEMATGKGGPGAVVASDKKIGDVAVKQFMSPFGVSVQLASIGQILLVSSSETELKQALDNIRANKEQFFASIPASSHAMFQGSRTVANFYLNFSQVGDFMENIGGMLSMYGGQQGPQGNPLTNPESIAALKRKGTIVGSVSIDGDLLDARSMYGAAAPAAPGA